MALSRAEAERFVRERGLECPCCGALLLLTATTARDLQGRPYPPSDEQLEFAARVQELRRRRALVLVSAEDAVRDLCSGDGAPIERHRAPDQ